MTCALPPVRGPISSPFGPRSFGDRLHTGVDFLGARGAAIRAPLAGRVISTHPISGYGNTIVLQHEAEGLYSLFAHLDRVLVRRGQRVARGKKIGTMGGTAGTPENPSRAVPVHLHFEFLTRWPPEGRDQNRIDPVTVLQAYDVLSTDDGSLAAACSPVREMFATLFDRVLRPYPHG